MEKNYSPLPDGPVICEVCAESGRKVEMRMHPQDASYEAIPPLADDTVLRTFRCPECENVSVFRASR